ncbi:MAG TPA: PfkB family carbohydrate kinase [Candidatus Limnocylindria bacterium]
MTDDIRADPDSPVDLLVVGGLTIDVLDGAQVVGGAARHSTEAAIAAGLRVALLTVAADEPVIRDWIAGMGDRVAWQAAATTIVFEHHGHHAARRLRLRSATDPIRLAEGDRVPPARALLFGPVAGEVTDDLVGGLRAQARSAGLQGWLRRTDAEGWVERVRLSEVGDRTAAALRGLDLLLASVDELRGEDGEEGIRRLRAWAGPGPELVVTTGADGAWVDDGHGPPRHVPAGARTDRHTIGAGDAFAAVLVARRAAGLDLRAAASRAAAATSRFLETRPDPLPPTIDS